MSLRQVVESAKDYQTITAVTINNRLRKLTAFFNWCKSNGYIEQNPLAGMKVMAGAAKDARLSFDRSDLLVLLNLDTLRQEARKHPWRFWLPCSPVSLVRDWRSFASFTRQTSSKYREFRAFRSTTVMMDRS